MKKEFKTNWDFKILYKGDKDSQIEKDLLFYENAVSSFEKKLLSAHLNNVCFISLYVKGFSVF